MYVRNIETSFDAPGPDPTGLHRFEARIDKLEAALLAQTNTSAVQSASNAGNGISLVVSGGHLDQVLAALTIATGAATMGQDVHLFFTFWATAALRKAQSSRKRSFIERVFGWMLPTGSKQLKLSNLHMAGLGTRMLKARMKDKNIPSLEELIDMAAELGIKISVCDMSMDLLGIKLDDLVEYPGLEVCGVASFLDAALGSRMTLFI